MEITRRLLRQLARIASGGRKNVDLARRNCEPLAIRGNAMVVINALNRAGIHRFRLSAGQRQAPELAFGVEQQISAVSRPVGCFKMARRGIDDFLRFAIGRNQSDVAGRGRALLTGQQATENNDGTEPHGENYSAPTRVPMLLDWSRR